MHTLDSENYKRAKSAASEIQMAWDSVTLPIAREHLKMAAAYIDQMLTEPGGDQP